MSEANKIFWSAKTEAFFLEDDYGAREGNPSFPSDVVEISRQVYNDCLMKENQGFGIYSDKKGRPVAKEKLYFKADLMAMLMEAKRFALANSDFVHMPDAKISAEDKKNLMEYRSFWRDVRDPYKNMKDDERKPFPVCPAMPSMTGN